MLSESSHIAATDPRPISANQARRR